MRNSSNTLIHKMITLGLSPKYRAFDYVFYILRNFDTAEIIKMKRQEAVGLICKRFGVSTAAVNSGLCTLIDASILKTSVFDELMPYREQGRNPSLKEYLIVLSVKISDIQE